MSRAFAPPDALSKEDIRTVADVRRAVWINGLFGLGAGTVTGMTGHLLLQTLQKNIVGEAGAASSATSSASVKGKEASWLYRCLRPLPPLGKNTFLLSMLGGGALGSFVLSTTAGKNAVHLLHPIFNVGRDEHAGKSPYQIAASKAQQQQQQEMTTGATTSATGGKEDELDAAHHRNRSLRRKASMKRRLESGQSLSDTHSNTWPHDNSNFISEGETEEIQRDRAMHRAEVWGKRQTNRRKTIRDRIEKGGALSDATGGQWST